MTQNLLAWHFVGDKLLDGRPIPKDGEWLIHEGKLKMCVSGLHASICPFDALQCAPGNTLCRVELTGEIIRSSDKVVATKRKILFRKDISHELRRFAADQALSVAYLWDMPDIVREYLTTLNELKMDEARYAANAVAFRVGARFAIHTAAWAAVWAAVRYSVFNVYALATNAAIHASALYAATTAADASIGGDSTNLLTRDVSLAVTWCNNWLEKYNITIDAAWTAAREQFVSLVNSIFPNVHEQQKQQP